jgi:hypothetical protein
MCVSERHHSAKRVVGARASIVAIHPTAQSGKFALFDVRAE